MHCEILEDVESGFGSIKIKLSGLSFELASVILTGFKHLTPWKGKWNATMSFRPCNPADLIASIEITCQEKQEAGQKDYLLGYFKGLEPYLDNLEPHDAMAKIAKNLSIV